MFGGHLEFVLRTQSGCLIKKNEDDYARENYVFVNVYPSKFACLVVQNKILAY